MAKNENVGKMYCANCRIQASEVVFMPSNGNPAPWICPVCGRTEVFTVDGDQIKIGLRNWPECDE